MSASYPCDSEATGLAGADCRHALDHLYEFLDSQMSPADEARMRAHVAQCSPCLAELSVEEIVRALVRRSCHERAPAQLRARIYAQVSVWRTVVDDG